jgi:disulfide bond formation protein DsbB
VSLTTISRFFTLLAFACLALVLLLVVARLGRWRLEAPETLRRQFDDSVQHAGLALTWLIAAVATAGSLYYSEVANLPPCKLCWYQRIAMYPLALLLGIAVVRRDRHVWRYVLPVTAIGGLIAAYHYALEWMPQLDAGACDPTVPCSLVWFRVFGFASIPFLSFAAFAAITAVMATIASAEVKGDRS